MAAEARLAANAQMSAVRQGDAQGQGKQRQDLGQHNVGVPVRVGRACRHATLNRHPHGRRGDAVYMAAAAPALGQL